MKMYVKIKLAVLVGGMLLIYGCTQRMFVSVRPLVNCRQLITDVIRQNVRCDTFRRKLVTFDRFLLVEFPGLPYNLSELSFSYIPDYIADLEELNKAWRFAKLTNRVIECDTLTQVSRFTTDVVVEECFHGITLLTSPTYGSSFLPVFPVPAITDTVAVWSRVSFCDNEKLIFNVSPKCSPLQLPRFAISFSILRLPVERGIEYGAMKFRSNHQSAIIKELLLVKELQLTVYDGYEIYYNPLTRKKRVKGHVSETVQQNGVAIIGYLCIVLGQSY